MVFEDGDTAEIIKNPKGKGYIVIVNPIGDKEHGYLSWKDIRFFKEERDAKAFQRFVRTGKTITIAPDGKKYWKVVR